MAQANNANIASIVIKFVDRAKPDTTITGVVAESLAPIILNADTAIKLLTMPLSVELIIDPTSKSVRYRGKLIPET